MSDKPPTKAEAERIQQISRLGCIVSRLRYRVYVPPDIHHIVEGYRLGHFYTIPLSPWYHRGVTESGMSQKEMTRLYGPSLALDKKSFERNFGSEKRLWMIVQRLLKLDRSWPSSKICPRRESLLTLTYSGG